MSTLDIRETNRAVRQLIEKTENPRHRYLLIAYDRHRNLEMAGRYEEIRRYISVFCSTNCASLALPRH